MAAITLMDIAALGLFGDASKTARDVYRELRRRCGPGAESLIRRCQEGAHPSGTSMPDPRRFVDDIKAVAQIVRKPEETPSLPAFDGAAEDVPGCVDSPSLRN